MPDNVRAVVEDEQSYSWITDEEPEGWRFHPIWQLPQPRPDRQAPQTGAHRRRAPSAGISIPEGIEPDSKFFHAEGRVTDGQVLASYLGADRGVGFMYDPGVILIA